MFVFLMESVKKNKEQHLPLAGTPLRRKRFFLLSKSENTGTDSPEKQHISDLERSPGVPRLG